MTEAAENTGNTEATPENNAKSSESSPKPASAGKARQNLFAQAGETFQFIEKAEKEGYKNIRTNDKNSIIFVVLAILAAGLTCWLYAIDVALRPVCVTLALISDFLFGLSILWFVLLRFGVIRSLDPRHALLCWQLMLGIGILLSYYTMNVAFGFFTLYNAATASPGT
ncbi:MAG: hypothetical protein K2X81_23335 [Candidatus Obscuribacterales bacterium]|nr:hypothetical protein [Candidatus Obscuribacterales bacterium]